MEVKEVKERGRKTVDDVARRVRARLDEMLIVDSHGLNHDASRTPAPIRRFDRIREHDGRVIAQLEPVPQVVREGEGLTIHVPANAPKGRGKSTDRPSEPAPDVVGGPVQLDPGSTKRLDQKLTVHPLLPHRQGQMLDRGSVGRETRVTRAVLALSNDKAEVDIFATTFGSQRPRD